MRKLRQNKCKALATKKSTVVACAHLADTSSTTVCLQTDRIKQDTCVYIMENYRIINFLDFGLKLNIWPT